MTDSERIELMKQALYEILDAGSTHVWTSIEKEDGIFVKEITGVKYSIEAELAKDVLDELGY